MNFYKKSFMVFCVFAITYNGCRYFYPWDVNKPLAPLYISILKDVPWFLFVSVGLYLLYRKKTVLKTIPSYRADDNYRKMSRLFIVFHISLLFVATVHLFHKNPIDVFQRDIKNVQYIFLPMLFPLLISSETDIKHYLNSYFGFGIIISVFAFSIHFLFPQYTWDGAVLATFQTPACYGFFLALLLLMTMARMLVEKVSTSGIIMLCIFYGTMLLTISFSAIVTVTAGTIFLIVTAKPSARSVLKICGYLLIASSLFYSIGLYTPYLQKFHASVSSYKKSSVQYEILLGEDQSQLPTKRSRKDHGKLNWLFSPYYPAADVVYQSKSQYTSITGRLIGISVFIDYLGSASFGDLILGDFSLKHQAEYDNTYLYFMRNDGVIITVMLFVLLCLGIIIGFKKYRLFFDAGNMKMAAISLGSTAFLLTATLIQFNLSYFLTIYPLNFITYYFLTLVFFINPSEPGKSHLCEGKS